MIIKINDFDNVATVSSEEGLRKNSRVEEFGLKILEDIPFGQKVLLKKIKKDEPIIRYGEVIGYSNSEKEKGQLIDEHSMYIKSVDNLSEENIGEFTQQYRFQENAAYEERYFLGYKNPDGTVGTRNLLAINTTVQCSEGFVNIAIKKIEEELLPKYKNVDGVVAINHLYGCGVAIKAKGSEIPQRTISNIAKNPNFGGRGLTVCLGCEKFKVEDAFEESGADSVLIMQDYPGMEKMMGTLMEEAESLLKELNTREREKIPVSELRVGLQCGGSDAFSGMTANPAIGYAADLLVQQGASVIFSEVTEVRDGVHLLLKRIKDEEIRKKMIQEMRWYDNYLEEGEVDRSANPSPGNKAGGLASIIDKAMGSITKSGTSEIVDVLSHGERIRRKGLTFAATPASDFVCGTQQLASGINIMVFSTGRGTTYNLKEVPVLKISTNNKLYKKWDDLIDINAGEIASKEKTIEQVGKEIFEQIIRTASGEKTCADKYKLYNQLAVFNPAPIT
ncbi:MAG: UxaA family hydrolase [Gallicola sp.]|nr:UxaA family hydrolase [Gallicola sp.]